MLGRIVYLTAGLAVICAFVGVKLVLQALHGSGVRWAAVVPPWLSVLVIAAVLLATVLAGTVASRHRWPAAARSVLARRFAAIDANGNGVLDAGDYQLAARRLCEAFGYAADSPVARTVATALGALFDRMLAHMDADGDRVITRDEFVTAAGREIGDRAGFDAAVGATARTLIQVADTDGNGVLDTGEYTRLAAVYGVDADEAARAFGRARPGPQRSAGHRRAEPGDQPVLRPPKPGLTAARPSAIGDPLRRARTGAPFTDLVIVPRHAGRMRLRRRVFAAAVAARACATAACSGPASGPRRRGAAADDVAARHGGTARRGSQQRRGGQRGGHRSRRPGQHGPGRGGWARKAVPGRAAA